MMIHLDGPRRPAGGAPAPAAPPLQRLCRAIDLAASEPLPRRQAAIAAAMRPYLGARDLLHPVPCPSSPDRYVRHLLHAGPQHTVLALVWRPCQMSPIHSHRTWCVLGIHCGCMTETFFVPSSGTLAARGCALRYPGDVSHDPTGPVSAHRLANLGAETAISIHVYGAAYDRLGEDVNEIHAA
ncbi:MAG TPA: cysteine dioxygenase family protein [Rhodopila sp.]|uniref:cysteine dioxygenase family protein n=1 Tax=Rhodopila sp. TaxID=2480087 RepID=UPI002C20A3E3|nr:cysteine dioxygenase family protein [Rhodopila sp.]HVY16292.1 cysteine dioxygenase family protein [Rhodopila sp.]